MVARVSAMPQGYQGHQISHPNPRVVLWVAIFFFPPLLSFSLPIPSHFSSMLPSARTQQGLRSAPSHTCLPRGHPFNASLQFQLKNYKRGLGLTSAIYSAPPTTRRAFTRSFLIQDAVQCFPHSVSPSILHGLILPDPSTPPPQLNLLDVTKL